VYRYLIRQNDDVIAYRVCHLAASHGARRNVKYSAVLFLEDRYPTKRKRQFSRRTTSTKSIKECHQRAS